MEAAAFLRESEEINNEQWRKFSNRFFAEYRDTILQYYGYESQPYYALPKGVNYPRFFIALMSVLQELEIIGCTPSELANILCGAFRFHEERSTIRKWLYEIPPEYEEFLDKFKDLFSTIEIKK